MDRMLQLPDGPATDLNHLYLTLRPEPLVSPEDFRKYYRSQVNAVRGEDTVDDLARELERSFRATAFKAFLMGHPGVGKSTEISRLVERVKDQHAAVRLSVAEELNPASFKVFEVLLLMLIRLMEAADQMKAIPLGGLIPRDLVSDIARWGGTEQIKKTRTETLGASLEAGAGAKEGSAWALLLGLFASMKGEMKYAAERKTETVEYRLQRLPDLIDTCNRLIDLCSRTLQEKTGQEWLLLVEDLDKAVISPQHLKEMFLQYGSVFNDLRVSMIFTIPVWLAYSPEADQLPFDRNMIHDTPVYRKNHEAHEEGRAAIRTVLEARVAASLFSDGQMTRLIVASGGNLRDLFALVSNAGDHAALKTPPARVIEHDDATVAISKMRRNYRMKLGQSPFDAEQIPYSKKSAILIAVYNGTSESDIPDPTLYSLLRGRAVQEFNGEGWYGVHPLVVDILKEQEHLKPQDPGGTS